MDQPEVLMDRIQQMPNSTCVMASFSSTTVAVETIKKLSFVTVDSVGVKLPEDILCEVLRSTTGAVVVIGGTLSEEQRIQTIELFQRFGLVKTVALPRQAATTSTSALSVFTPPSPLADLRSRILAGIVDYIIIGIIVGLLPVSVVTGPGMPFGLGWLSGILGIIGLMWLLWLIYFTCFEGTSGQTIGKKLTHIRVVKEDGSRCDFGSALVRNILRIVDHLPFLYILGTILIAATEKKQRLGDILAKTIAVKT